jgi:glycosyltransferase involved in cell wall biosynthesis
MNALAPTNQSQRPSSFLSYAAKFQHPAQGQASPRLSFIMPTYNRAHCISAAIKSALAESHEDEIVVVDDQSTDNTRRLLERQFAREPVVYVRPPRKAGATGARNYGLEHATGDVFVFLDSDDEILEGGANHIREFFRTHPGIDIHFGPTVSKSTGQVATTTLARDRAVRFDEFLAAAYIGEFLPSCRAHLFRTAGFRFPDDLNGFEGILWASLMRAGHDAYYDVRPVRLYDDTGCDRLCSPDRLARDVLRLARGYEAYLTQFGADLCRLNPKSYALSALKYAAYARATKPGSDLRAQFRRWQLPMPFGARVLAWAPAQLLTLANSARLGLRRARTARAATRALVSRRALPSQVAA